ncbi:hypothetical protein H5410_036994 [Solanum commersonii]|uniref:Uncharacterized protein n=1 Tax=Solanum commersonii TaxID=4109 RepID=A0A9J5Y6T0_SOLCO|nr:hypothetical protein H5410_036994 [Solanum commersonii]
MEIVTSSKPVDLQVKNPIVKNASTNWTVIPHKKLVGHHIGSSAGRSNSPSQEKSATEKFLLCVDPNIILPTQNVFVPSSTRKNSTRALYGKDIKLLSIFSLTSNMIISKENQEIEVFLVWLIWLMKKRRLHLLL